MSCPGCYVPVTKSGPHGLPIENWVEIINNATQKGAVHLTIVGGEPGARRNELHHVVGLATVTWIVTTFFYEIPAFVKDGTQKPVTFIVSIDGTDDVHNSLRGVPNLAAIARQHITTGRDKARSGGLVYPIFTHSVLLAANASVMEETIRQWDNFVGIDGMVFSTAVPPRSDPHPSWSPTTQQRADFVKLLLKMKKAGARINMSTAQIELLHPDQTRAYKPTTCPISRRVESYDFLGNLKGQCIFGPGSDCSQCGCVVNGMIGPFHRTAETGNPMLVQVTQLLPELSTVEKVTDMIYL